MEFNSTSNNKSEWMPLLASGVIGADYTVVKFYIEVAREMNKDYSSILISSEDLGYVKLAVENMASRKLDFLIDLISKRFTDRIDPYIARETYKRYLKVDVDERTAVQMLSRVLAVWCIEAAEVLGYVKLQKSYG
ncbi:MAG: hypothetical protein QXS45_02700 [Sulfolobales archaeon]